MEAATVQGDPPAARRRPRRVVGTAALAAAVLALAGVAAALVVPGHRHPARLASGPPSATPVQAGPALHPHPRVVDPVAGQVGAAAAPQLDAATTPDGSGPPTAQATATAAPSPGAPSDAQVRNELAQEQRELALFQRYLSSGASSAILPIGPAAKVLSDGRAVAPSDAPAIVDRIIKAGNAIATMPYIWGGGHTRWRDHGYDCSGSVSYALAAAGLLDTPLTSGEFMSWGQPGPGRWVTLFASPAHVFMVVAGLRFDTGGLGVDGTRWQPGPRSAGGFVAVHPPGL